MVQQVPVVDGIVTTYAAASDYCKIFEEQMHSLYLLAFLLTADTDKAERCFIGGLGECVDGSGICMEAPRSWPRQAIIRYAIRMIRPAQDQDVSGLFASDVALTSATSNPFAVIVSLSSFERFVFVMSVLEGQPDEYCESLLRCSRQEVVMARKAALGLFVAVNTGYERHEECTDIWQGLLN